MYYIQAALLLSLYIFITIVIIGALMKVANYIGELLGFGKLSVYILQKLIRHKEK